MTTEVHIEMLFKNRMFSKASHEMSESELRPYKSRLSLYISVLIYIPSTMFTDIHNLQTSTGIPNAPSHHLWMFTVLSFCYVKYPGAFAEEELHLFP